MRPIYETAKHPAQRVRGSALGLGLRGGSTVVIQCVFIYVLLVGTAFGKAPEHPSKMTNMKANFLANHCTSGKMASTHESIQTALTNGDWTIVVSLLTDMRTQGEVLMSVAVTVGVPTLMSVTIHLTHCFSLTVCAASHVLSLMHW